MFVEQLLEQNTPGKVGGSPGNAFEAVYTVVTGAVREKMHGVDPVLAEYIRSCLAHGPSCHPACVLRLHATHTQLGCGWQLFACTAASIACTPACCMRG